MKIKNLNEDKNNLIKSFEELDESLNESLEEEDPSADYMYARPVLKVDAAIDQLKALEKGEKVEAFKEN